MSLLSEKLAPLWSEISKLRARQMSIFPATVTDTNPVRIRIDGESQSLAATPDNGLPVGQGDRVRVLRYGTSHLIVARMNTGRQPFAMAAGATLVPANDGWNNVYVSFPPGRFTKEPIVTLTPAASAVSVISSLNAANTDASGFDIYQQRSGSGTSLIMWHAIQMEA